MVRLPFYIIFWGQQIEKKTRNAWQSLAYSPLGDVVSPQTAKYSNFCIIKTINAIKTKFCTVIKTIKFSLEVVPKFAPQIQNGGRTPS